ncbi:MAG: prolyl oligopeptidase family serine peptidase [Saprospiraceae bacterium]|nr:prolyl oligopeptidase family serine peptidase [Saprospiraceae bacterium]MCF8250700.1 prolyl oligopeptidase family serine peptidase [Saprospiraceae bacterium]MCF8283149.1 prolyl oligopeptidase family serine peptidase [Bacteroidales bacterium]MCF8312552.1 prolyl oligopeptidase family serine peptidase [Saprospiraceae bacterium]MCF8440768.1 prolyl oligopeptidase family serine peptidase [Saprospiraceae bacterium]
MRNKLKLISLLSVVCGPVFAQYNYPVARTEPFDTLIFDQKISDEYFWMSRKNNEPEMLEFAKQQSNLTQSYLDSIPGTDAIMNEIGDGYFALQNEIWNVKPANGGIYYQRDIPEEGVWLCHRASMDSPEEKVLKSAFIQGKKYSIRKRVFSRNSPLVAMMLTENGEANPHIRIFDLAKKEFLPDSIGPVMFNDSRGVSMTWLPDDKGLLYTQAPPTEKHHEKYYNGKIKLHILGEKTEEDVAVFGSGVNPDISLKDIETPYVYSFNHSPYIIARLRAGDRDNYAYAVHYSKLNGKNTPWVLLKDYVNLSDGFDANGQYLYAVTKGADRYQVVKINMETGDSPAPFLPEQPAVIAFSDSEYRSGIVAGKDVLYVLTRQVGDMQILKVDFKTTAAYRLPLSSKTSIAQLSLSGENDLLFGTFSATRSTQYLLYKHAENKLSPLPFAEPVYDAGGQLQTEVLLVPSRDGKAIPVSIVYQKGLNLKNKNPLIIEAYGNSGASHDMYYDPNMLPWLTRGGIYAYAHVRGGGEMGEDWMQDGQFPNKMNSINDVVDVADYFVKQVYTSPDKQFVMGGSAGTFLVGMGINQRPDLFAGGLFLAGLPDIATYADAAGAREQKSVGTLGTKEGFEGAYSVSSYYHIPTNKILPAMFISHGATDYILALHPAVRYAARLQKEQQGERPIFLFVDWAGGHNGGELDILYTLKFALWQSGHPDFQLK